MYAHSRHARHGRSGSRDTVLMTLAVITRDGRVIIVVAIIRCRLVVAPAVRRRRRRPVHRLRLTATVERRRAVHVIIITDVGATRRHQAHTITRRGVGAGA